MHRYGKLIAVISILVAIGISSYAIFNYINNRLIDIHYNEFLVQSSQLQAPKDAIKLDKDDARAIKEIQLQLSALNAKLNDTVNQSFAHVGLKNDGSYLIDNRTWTFMPRPKPQAAAPAPAPAPPNGSATTTGDKSPANTGSGNKISVK